MGVGGVDETPLGRLTDTPEGLQRQVVIHHAMASRRADLIGELGNLFDSLRPILEQAAPGWWEENDPIALIEGELDGWRPSRVFEEKRAAGLVHRGPMTPEQREDLKRRTIAWKEGKERPHDH